MVLTAAIFRVMGAFLMELGTVLDIFIAERMRAEHRGNPSIPRPSWYESMPGDGDEEADESGLMQQARQPGDLRTCQVEEVANQLWSELLAKYNWTLRKSKHMLFAIGAMVSRNRNSLLPSMRQMCKGLQEVLDHFAEKIMEVPMERDERAAKWARSFWKGVRGKCRGAVARHKKRVRAEQRRLRLQQEAQRELELEAEAQQALEVGPEEELPPPAVNDEQMVLDRDADYGEIVDEDMLLHDGQEHEVLDDEHRLEGSENDDDEVVMLMQGKMSWVKFLQEDMEHLKAWGERIGAYVTQLQALMQPEATHDAEALAMVQALLAAYAAEPTDESRPDRADNFARKWWERLRVLLQGPGVTVVETQQTDLDEQAKILEQVYGEAFDRRLVHAQQAQAEDDRAMQEALQLSAQTTSPTRATSSGGAAMDVMVRRVLINGVHARLEQPVAVTGQKLELAAQMGVCFLPSGDTGPGSEASSCRTTRVSAHDDKGKGSTEQHGRGHENGEGPEGHSGREGGGIEGQQGEPVLHSKSTRVLQNKQKLTKGDVTTRARKRWLEQDRLTGQAS